jgi:DNA-binding ferritin-like protein
VTIHVNTEGTQIEAIAERLRKLNERIIEVGREAGESTLGSYEKALKTFATGISKGPAKDELEWIQHLAASQAKFVREITDSVAKAARERLR